MNRHPILAALLIAVSSSATFLSIYYVASTAMIAAGWYTA